MINTKISIASDNGKITVSGFKTVEVSTPQELGDYLNNYAVVFGRLKNGYRKNANILECCSLIKLDIDSNIEDLNSVRTALKDYLHVEVPSRSDKDYKRHIAVYTNKPLSIDSRKYKVQVRDFIDRLNIKQEWLDYGACERITQNFAPSHIDNVVVKEGKVFEILPEYEISEDDIIRTISKGSTQFDAKGGSEEPTADIVNERYITPDSVVLTKNGSFTVRELSNFVEVDSYISISCPYCNEEHESDFKTVGYGFAYRSIYGDMIMECSGNACQGKKPLIMHKELIRTTIANIFDAETGEVATELRENELYLFNGEEYYYDGNYLINDTTRVNVKFPSALEKKSFFQLDDTPMKKILLNGVPYPEKGLTMLAGDGGVGKSFIVSHLAASYLQKYDHKKVLFWFTEDYESVVRERIKGICHDRNTLNRMHFITSDIHTIDDAIAPLEELSKRYGLIILDPLISFFHGNENDNADARAFGNRMKQLSGLVILIHHSAKAGSASRGASDFRNMVRLVYKVEKPIVTYKKSTYERKVDDIDLLGHRALLVNKDNWGITDKTKKTARTAEDSGYLMKIFDVSKTYEDDTRKREDSILEELDGLAKGGLRKEKSIIPLTVIEPIYDIDDVAGF